MSQNNINTVTLKIDGMTCVSCENKIEKKLNNTIGITSAKVSYSMGTAKITYDENVIGLKEIEKTIEKLDYKIIKLEQQSNKKNDISKILGITFVIFALYLLIRHFGGFNIFNVFPQAEEGMGYGMLFVIGLLTSIHCVAMCGGINLSQCVPKAAVTENGSKLSTLLPSLLYNTGRVISYTIVGGIVGALGSVISFSGTAKGIVQITAGVFMVIMGLNMLNIFPWLRNLNPRMPKIFTNKINQQKSSKSPLYVGLLNGLMPCGPLQAMQLYALSTGNPFKGALSMLLFSLGTVPLMFGLGALSSLLSKKFTKKMMTASAVLVVILGVFMFSSGMSLSGIAVPSFSSNGTSSVATVNSGVQTVTTVLSSGSYQPITVQKGIPVKWIIKADASNINGCNNQIVIPKFNIQKKLEAGDNIIEFTPNQSGTFAYSCWMGMIRSKIKVVDDLSKAGTSDSNKSSYKIPTDQVAVAKLKNGKQYIEISMDDKRFTPAIIVLQSGIETVWNIKGVKITENNKTLSFPKYNTQLNIQQGDNQITFTPNSDFDFSTSDNLFFGYVKVVKDINKVDIDSVKKEISKYAPVISDVVDSTGVPSCCSGGATQ